MAHWFKAYGLAALAFLVLDGVWLGLIARSFYQSRIGAMMRTSILPIPAVAFYVIYLAALVQLVVMPAAPAGGRGDIGQAALNGALMGLAAYAAYDLSNLSTLKGWATDLAVVDLVWGAALSAASAAFAVWALRLVG